MHTSELERWRKRLDKEVSQPAYRLVAELIAEDIGSGRLQPRERLPPLRELAGALSINYTTAARAYNEAKLRGLIDSHPGSGTFIKGKAVSVKPSSGYEMTMNLMIEPAIPTLIERVRDSAISVLAQRDLYSLLRYQTFGGSHHDRVAALQWLDRRLDNTTLEQVLICPGIHSGLVGLLMQLVAPGQLICVESLVYPGLKAIAAQLGLTLHSLERDSDGPLVRSFEDICKQGQVAVLYINPTIKTPRRRLFPWGVVKLWPMLPCAIASRLLKMMLTPCSAKRRSSLLLTWPLSSLTI
ncbi:GntR family transcriptional regulator [Halomonas sp. SBBP1]|uniref:GntR family transcriptional regulator n=1 Tax=Halomonas sp. SBBP1 TaxID=2599306 RepID=UPI001CF4DB4D|nr:GntR family transcriptional regulator [Halomonas sp. SBBP1]